MTTEQATITNRFPAALAGESIAYGPVHVDVTSLERSLGFWGGLIGLAELGRDGASVNLGAGGRTLLTLREGAAHPAGRGHAGLYHLAIHLPDPVEFARVMVRLAQHRVPQSPTDHVFSKATYVHDPDGIMLELTLETPERYGSIAITPGSVVMYDNEGRARQPTAPLDVAAAVAPLAGGDPERPLPVGTYVGHVHLHVPALEDSYAFYRDVVGFQEHAFMGAIGMADLGAGGAFPHRIAINVWNGPHAVQAPAGTAGMRSFELLVADPSVLEPLAARAGVSRGTDGSVSLQDPAGNHLTLRAAAS